MPLQAVSYSSKIKI